MEGGCQLKGHTTTMQESEKGLRRSTYRGLHPFTTKPHHKTRSARNAKAACW
jgi:hypothetical protein